MEKICVVGLGYIGLPTASLLATKGFQVEGVDVNPAVLEKLRDGKATIREPDLDILVKSAVQSGKLKVAAKPSPADVFILAVPTPFKGDHQPDISYVRAAAESIAPVIQNGNLVIVESTIPIGTTEEVVRIIKQARPDLGFPEWKSSTGNANARVAQIFVAHCPERVLPGKILQELVGNDRVVGGVDDPSSQRARDFYRSFVSGEVHATDARTAELCKLSENAFRDVNIAFANELSVICDRYGIDVWELIGHANRHPRVKILQPGPGVGGHCIAVDPWFIVAAAPDDAKLIRAARQVNDAKPQYVVEKINRRVEAVGGKPTVLCLGITFKANVDDIRESPALDIVERLQRLGTAKVLVADPYVEQLPRDVAGATLCSLADGLKHADIVVLLVDHKEFLDLEIPLGRIAPANIIDTRGAWNRE